MNNTILSIPQGENMDPIENVLCYMGKRPCDNVDGKYIYVCRAPKLEKYSKRPIIDVTANTFYYMF